MYVDHTVKMKFNELATTHKRKRTYIPTDFEIRNMLTAGSSGEHNFRRRLDQIQEHLNQIQEKTEQNERDIQLLLNHINPHQSRVTTSEAERILDGDDSSDSSENEQNDSDVQIENIRSSEQSISERFRNAERNGEMIVVD